MSELIEQLRRNAAEKHMIELKLQEQELQEAHGIITAEASSLKRKSDRVNNRSKVKIIKTTAKDKIRIKGLQGTLGSNLTRLASEIVVKSNRSKYFSQLSKNSIIDISNDKRNSQIALLGGSNVKVFLRRFKHESYERYPLASPFLFGKVDGIRLLKKKYEELDIYHPNDQKEMILKKICVHILYACTYNPSSLNDKYLKKCSEQSLLIRYWGNIFEYYFGQQQKVFLQWGDTVSSSCKESNLFFRLDIRMVAEKDDTEIDVVNGEVASVSCSSRGKYYKDALKLALSAKQYLNGIISSLHGLTPKELSSIKLPIVQIMGMNCHISCINIIDKNVYALQDIYAFNYPKTIKEIKEGAIDDIMTGLLLIDNMIADLNDVYNNFSKNTGDKIELIRNERKQKKKIEVCSDYISAVDRDSSEYDVLPDAENESDSEDDDLHFSL